MKLTSWQWSLIAPLVSPSVGQGQAPRGRGRPSQDARAVLEGVFWVMRTGARWADLPGRYPPYQTCHRRFVAWRKDGVLSECLRRLATDLAAESRNAVGTAPRTWQGATASLLASPLGRQLLSATPSLRTDAASVEQTSLSNERPNQ